MTRNSTDVPAAIPQSSAGQTAPSPAPSSLSWREKISYGVADMGFNFYWTNISAFLMIFYTDVFGITAAAAGTMLLQIKSFNAFTDPMLGAIADRTRTRFGKFRPYLIWMALPLAVAGVLTYTTPSFTGNGKLAWAYGSYLFMMLCYTGINIPYNSLSGVMSSNPQERTTINGLRFIFAFGGSMLVTAITPWLVKTLGGGNERLGWQFNMMIWGIAASGIFVLTFFNTRERISPPAAQKTNLWRDIADLARNRSWVVLFFLAPIIMVTITLRNATAAYYFKYYVEKPDLLAAFLPSCMAASAAGASLTPVLTKFIDKRNLLMLLMSITGALSVAFYFVPKNQIILIFALQIAISFAIGPKSPLAFAMYADTADYNEWRTGRRATGLTFSAATFSQKLGTAISAALMGWIFTKLGYAANQTQTAESLKGILMLSSFIPALFAFAAVAVMLFYKLDKHAMAKIESDLQGRKSA